MPFLLLEDHPKHVILSQSVVWGPASLLEGIGANQEVGTCIHSLLRPWTSAAFS